MDRGSGERRTSPLVILSLGLVVLALFHLLTGTLPASRQLRDLREGNRRMRGTLRELRDERRAAEDLRDGLLHDPQTIERELRRSMNMIRPDETAVVPAEGIRR